MEVMNQKIKETTLWLHSTRNKISGWRLSTFRNDVYGLCQHTTNFPPIKRNRANLISALGLSSRVNTYNIRGRTMRYLMTLLSTTQLIRCRTKLENVFVLLTRKNDEKAFTACTKVMMFRQTREITNSTTREPRPGTEISRRITAVRLWTDRPDALIGSATHEIPRIFWSPKAQYCIHNSLPLS
jgi:hypothetical protein